MQEMNKELKEMKSLQKMKTMFSSPSSGNCSIRWLQTVGQAYMKRNPAFSIRNYNSLIDEFSVYQGTIKDAYKQFGEMFEALNYSQKKNTSTMLPDQAMPACELEVAAVLDNMILILEVQEEIENQIKYDFKWTGLDLYIEKEIDKNLLKGFPVKAPLILNPKYLVLSQVCKAVTDINTSQIFTSKYVKNLQTFLQNSQPLQDSAPDFITCDSKFLQKIMAISEGLGIRSETKSDLLIDLTILFLNTYNYCSYIKEKKYFFIFY